MLFCIFILFGNKISAQVGLETNRSSQVEIFLGGNATLHSSDEIFNAQISSQKIKINSDQKSLLSIRKVGSKIIISNNRKSENFSGETRIAKRKKTAEIKSFTEKKIKAALAKIKYDYRDILKPQPSEHFAFFGGTQKQTFINAWPTHDFHKAIFKPVYVAANIPMDFLYTFSFTCCNSIIKDDGYTNLYTSRPPPQII